MDPIRRESAALAAPLLSLCLVPTSLPAIPEAQAAYPPALVLGWLFPAHQAPGISLFLHQALLLLGVYYLSRCLDLGRGPALATALVLGYGGPVVSGFQDLPSFSTLAYLPWLLALATRRGARSAGAGLCPARWILSSALLALSFLAGEPRGAMASLVIFITLSWFRPAVPEERGGLRGDASRLVGPLASVLLGIGMAAIVLVPWLQSVSVIRLELHTPGFELGVWLTGVTSVLWIFAVSVTLLRRQRPGGRRYRERALDS